MEKCIFSHKADVRTCWQQLFLSPFIVSDAVVFGSLLSLSTEIPLAEEAVGK